MIKATCQNSTYQNSTVIRYLFLWLACSMLNSCAGPGAGGMQLAGCPVNGNSQLVAKPQGNARSEEELLTVDCLLPGMQIEIGQGIFWTTPPRPARTSLWQCQVSGGQHVAYDAANLQDVARIWQECANAGDKIAQTYLGEIYERKADYSNAAAWYRKAAKQNYARAQANLGFLYEKGLGVNADKSVSLEWYRLAAGLPEAAPNQPENSTEIQQLRAALAKTSQELQVTRRGLSQKQAELDHLRSAPQLQQRIPELEHKVKADQETILALQTKIASISRGIEKVPDDPNAVPASPGRYFALVIGIADYSAIPKLETPVNDAEAVAELLKSKYGFTSIKLLLNEQATRTGIFKALGELKTQLTENDSLLIYYAGHGLKQQQFGYWAPIDADKSDQNGSWINDAEIAENISVGIMRARHVLIVADSCFAGTLYDVALANTPQTPDTAISGMSFEKAKFSQTSRKALTSGGDEPVLDKGSSKHSVFAEAFIDFLKNYNQADWLSASEVHRQIEKVVFESSSRLGHPQQPIYGRISGGGELGGEFYFKPTGSTAVRDVRFSQAGNQHAYLHF